MGSQPRHLLRNVLLWGAVAVIAVIALSVVVGFVGAKHGFGWELAAVFGTALGTTLLAITTGLLALMTWRDVSAAQKIAQLAGEQSETARDALDAQTQPFMTVGAQDRQVLYAGVLTRSNQTRLVQIGAHLRNVGNAAGVVTQVRFAFTETVFTGGAPDPAVPPGETTSVTVGFAEDSPLFEDAEGVVTGATNFSVGASYADVSGRPRGAVRLDVYRTPGGDWWVRQVFWAETLDEVFVAPALGSQPVH